MSFFIPCCLQEHAPDIAPTGERWLADLPARVATLERDWSLTIGRALDTDSRLSWVAPVQLEDGSGAILKIGIPHREARREADALRAWKGRGAVHLLRASEDGFSLLLERCLPGTDLWSLDEPEADTVGASVLRRLWRDPPPGSAFEPLSALAAEWCQSLPTEAPAAGYDAPLIARAVDLARQLAATQPQPRLLHGDFHPGNVLAATREPWLAIDCKPLIGDPAYDLAQWLGNRCDSARRSPEPVAAIQYQIERFSRALNLDPARVAGWAFVKSLGWDWGPPSVRLLHAAFERCAGSESRCSLPGLRHPDGRG